jgi:hypothetical protein
MSSFSAKIKKQVRSDDLVHVSITKESHPDWVAIIDRILELCLCSGVPRSCFFTSYHRFDLVSADHAFFTSYHRFDLVSPCHGLIGMSSFSAKIKKQVRSDDLVHVSITGGEMNKKSSRTWTQHWIPNLFSTIQCWISDSNRTVNHQSIDNAVQIILQYGRKSTLSKIDIEHAYKMVPISPSSCHLLGFRLSDKYYFDKTLPMKLSYSCNLFEKFSNAVHWIVENKLGAKFNNPINDCNSSRVTFFLCKKESRIVLNF